MKNYIQIRQLNLCTTLTFSVNTMSTPHETHNETNHKNYDIKKYITLFSEDFKKYKNKLVATKNYIEQYGHFLKSLDNFYLYTVSSKYNTILYNDYSENNLNDVSTYYKDFQLEVTCNTNLHECKQMITSCVEQIIKMHKHYSNKLELSANIEQKEENNEKVEDKDNENVEEKVEDDENIEDVEDEDEKERNRLYRYNENCRLKIVLLFAFIVFIYMHLFLKVTFRNGRIEKL
jgi:hypothetical protein